MTNFAVALQTALTDDTIVRLFVPGVFFLVNVIGVGIYKPYKYAKCMRLRFHIVCASLFLSTSWRNSLYIVIGLAQVAHIIVYLGLFQATGSTLHASSGYLWSLISLTLIAIMVGELSS